MMNSIIDNQRDILLSVEGTNIWSGQQPQQYNSQAVAWGGLSHELFAHGKRYQWVTWGYVHGYLCAHPVLDRPPIFPKITCRLFEYTRHRVGATHSFLRILDLNWRFCWRVDITSAGCA